MRENESPTEYIERIRRMVKERKATEAEELATERGQELNVHARARAAYEARQPVCIEKSLYDVAGSQICQILRTMSRSEDAGVRNLGQGMNAALFLIMQRVASYCYMTVAEVCEVLDVTTTMHLYSDAMEESRNRMILQAFSPQVMANRSDDEKLQIQREIECLQGKYAV